MVRIGCEKLSFHVRLHYCHGTAFSTGCEVYVCTFEITNVSSKTISRQRGERHLVQGKFMPLLGFMEWMEQINPLSNYIISQGIFFFLCIHLSLVGIVASEQEKKSENNVIKSIDFLLEAQA